MLNSVRILNFDNSVIAQENLLKRYNPSIVDLVSMGPSCRMWCNARMALEVKNALKITPRDTITFLGSGDFHHISSLLIRQFEEPLSIIVFDHHPDWDIMPPRLACGSWVTHLLRKKNIKKIIILGVSSNDISTAFFPTGNFNALRDDRLEIYPYAHGPTNVIMRNVPDNISVHVERGFLHSRIHWQELQRKNIVESILHIVRRLETKQVYVSIDKDCLEAPYALTNWEEGRFELDELLVILKLIKENADIVGVDITGEYSPPVMKGVIKKIFGALDHPRDYSAKGKARSTIDSTNEKTNIRLLELLMK